MLFYLLIGFTLWAYSRIKYYLYGIKRLNGSHAGGKIAIMTRFKKKNTDKLQN